MVMQTEDHNDPQLEAFFAAAREQAPKPSPALIDRVLADAAGPHTAQPGAIRPNAIRLGPSLWARLADALGGWQGLGGLVSATVAGLWIGYAGLADPGGYVAGFWDDEAAVELMPGAEIFAAAEIGEE